jgi:Zn-dependent M16 (insulinase) family peptidase
MTFSTPQTLNHVGTSYKGFVVEKTTPIHELQCTLRELVHQPTGARIMHIGNDDPENLFCLSFQTFPKTSNGVAHILEHTVLCGSEKYPVKDPFFAMQRRSLNTFMNALTGADFTCYPASSQVKKDFYNLLEVYLDAVFKPSLKELSFLQEGVRLEFQKPDDPNSALDFKGIVFNEMKGSLANPTARLVELVNELVFPNITYGINSGGDPKVIPDLTYAELKEFHSHFYHPSRCLFFFYGNLPLEGHLDFLLTHCLEGVQKMAPLPPVPHQPRFTQPVYKEGRYPIPHDEDPREKTNIAFAWLTSSILNQEEILALSVLEIVFMDTDASPLKMALLKSGYCKQASAYAEVEISEVPFVILLKGCEPEHADALEEVIKETLQKLHDQGIPDNLVESAIHQLEIFRTEITGDGSPYGLALFMRSALLKQHGGEPESGLMIHSLFEKLRSDIKNDPHYLTGLIKKYFLDNTHFVRVVMVPSPEVAKEEQTEERQRLDRIRSALAPEQINDIMRKSQELQALQIEQLHQDLEVLPKVTLADVPKQARDYALEKTQHGNIEVYRHDCFTNDIVYAGTVFNMPDVPESLMPYVRLFTVLLSQLGCGGRNYAENLEYIQANTGGIGFSLGMYSQASDYRKFVPTVQLRGKALHRKADKLFPLMREMIESVDFTDMGRIVEILHKHYTGLQSSIPQSALKYAINLSSSGLNAATKVSEDWYGITYFKSVRDIVQNLDKNIGKVIEVMQQLQGMLLSLQDAHLILSCDDALYQDLVNHEFYGLQHLQVRPYQSWKGNFEVPPVVSHTRAIASPVAFTAKVFPLVSYTHPDTPALCIASYIFDNNTLHTRIREQGGAYGGGSSCNPLVGTFYFYAYRDPNLVTTLLAFEDAVKAVAAGQFDESDLEEAKLETIQVLDSPVSPGSRADLAYAWLREGRTQPIRQAFRDKLLALTKEDVKAAVERHILPNLSKGSVVSFAGKELIEKENSILVQNGIAPFPIEQI